MATTSICYYRIPLAHNRAKSSFERIRNALMLRRPRQSVAALIDSVTSNNSRHEHEQEQARGLQFLLTIGAKVIPHPEKVEKGGEDAFFTSHFDGGVLGIADGVSGWAEENVDPALFSKEFVNHLTEAADLEEFRGNPKALLGKAEAATASIGAATAIVATLMGKTGILRVANVGDCGLRIVRDGKVVFATTPQQHYFDCPFQFSSQSGGQTAEDAAIYEIQIKEGDILVMGSDGLFDNVYDSDIAATVNLFGGSDQEAMDKTATALATLANRNSKDVKYDSPYIKEAIFQGYDVPIWKKLLGEKLSGGKLDDITVLVGFVGMAEVFTPTEEEALLVEDVQSTSNNSASSSI